MTQGMTVVMVTHEADVAACGNGAKIVFATDGRRSSPRHACERTGSAVRLRLSDAA